MVDVNLTGSFLTLREGLRAMHGKPWGRAIAIASTAGLRGYGIAKLFARRDSTMPKL